MRTDFFRSIAAAVAVLLVSFPTSAWADEPLRVAVAGITHDHISGVVSALTGEDVDVVGVWEADSRYIHKNALTGKIPENLFYSDLGKMLDETKPEAVVAYGSIKDHLAVVEACGPRGIHVMVEKPLAASLKDARKMEAIARKYGILVLTNYETTWYGTNWKVKEMVDAGDIGPVRKILVFDGHQGPIEIRCSKKFTDWLTDPVLNGGGAVMDFGCYGADLATWLLKGKRPDKVYAVLQHNKPDVYPKVDDDATITLTYPGITVQVMGSWCWSYNRKDMFVYGDKGFLYQETPRRMSGLVGNKRFGPMEAEPLKAPYDNSFRYLRAAVRGEINVADTDLGALQTNMIVVEILDAAIRSAKSGKAVSLR